MADYNDHLFQVRRNLKFLGSINASCGTYIDWQVTASFYVGVHLINSFLAREANLHFGSHEKVKDAISPDSKLSTRLPDAPYLAYGKLRNLSRRSRYLCAEDNEDPGIAHYTLERHLIKAIKNLDALMKHFFDKYSDEYPVVQIIFPFTEKIPNCIFFKFTNSSATAKETPA